MIPKESRPKAYKPETYAVAGRAIGGIPSKQRITRNSSKRGWIPVVKMQNWSLKVRLGICSKLGQLVRTSLFADTAARAAIGL